MNGSLTKEELEYIIQRVIANADDVIKNTSRSEFALGKRLAYYEVLDTIKNELIIRDVSLAEYGLDFDLEKTLL